MKARIIGTNDVIRVEWNAISDHWMGESAFDHCKMYPDDSIEILPNEPETLTTEFDWDAFRNETAAKEFIMLEQIQPYDETNFATAVNRTNKLIRQLKETPSHETA